MAKENVLSKPLTIALRTDPAQTLTTLPTNTWPTLAHPEAR